MKSKVIAGYFLVGCLLVSTLFINAGFSSTLLEQKNDWSLTTLKRDMSPSENSFPIPASDGGETQILIDPAQKTVAVGPTCAFGVNVTNVINMYAYEFRLTWNCSVVELQSAVRPAGNFMEPLDPANQFVAIWKINETLSGDLQTAHFAYALLAPEPAKTGSGILVVLTFRALAVGSTLLDLKDTKLADNAALPIAHSDLDALVTVSPPISVTISPLSVAMDVGQSQQFTSSVSGGVSPFAYEWFLNNAPVSGATSATWTFTPSFTGFYEVYVNVTDYVNSSAKSGSAAVAVNPPISVAISPTSVVMNVNQSQLLTSSVTNGTPPYVYQWYLNDVTVSGATSPTWTFVPTTNGTYYVYLKVTDSANSTVQSDTANITVVPKEVVHDIALANIANSKSGCLPIPTIGENGTLQINVTAYNLGESSESFEVIVYANATEIQRILVLNLAEGSHLILAFDWSTVGFVKGNYVISAHVEPVMYETNTTDNSVIGEVVAIVTLGDINADGEVDIFDLVRVAVAFGAVPTNTNWDPNADTNSDRIIDIFDLVAVALNF